MFKKQELILLCCLLSHSEFLVKHILCESLCILVKKVILNATIRNVDLCCFAKISEKNFHYRNILLFCLYKMVLQHFFLIQQYIFYFHVKVKCIFKGTLSGLRQFFLTESRLKMMKNAFYFTSQALSVLKIFKFLSSRFGHV